MKPTNKIILISSLALGLFALGRSSIGWGTGAPAEGTGHEGHVHEEAEPTIWICPMHPQIQLPDFVPCPICGMDLVAMEAGGDDNPRRMSMSPAARELANIAVQRVHRKNVSRLVRMTGKVTYDETRIRTISAWIAGRLDRLFVDYTGARVQEGEHLVRLYSPDLLAAQEELLLTHSRLSNLVGDPLEYVENLDPGESSSRVPSFLVDSYRTARDKLILWGLTPEQVAGIEAGARAQDNMVLTSPTSGVVIDKFLEEGAYVKTGTSIYRVADLSRLWVTLDAYEQDLTWLRYGQPIHIEAEALPGTLIEGSIAYIDPAVDEHTRSAKVRVNIDNSEGLLKPGMFVRAAATSRLGGGGRVIDPSLAGKWVSPMHPEIVKDGPGQCDVCGMDLVPAETLGLASPGPTGEDRPLVIPKSAVLITGKRAVVYVEVPGADQPTYEGREVELGPRAGGDYIVLAGLREGERVVTHGAFRIDSAMQIMAKPSMMSMEPQPHELSSPEGLLFRRALAPIFAHAVNLQLALAGDDEGAARTLLKHLATELTGPSAVALPQYFRTLWGEEQAVMTRSVRLAMQTQGIEDLRVHFEPLSMAFLSLAREFGHLGQGSLYEAYCPMAFDDKGAAWLQGNEELLNPYFGASMLRCGEIREEFTSYGLQDEDDPAAGSAQDIDGREEAKPDHVEHEHPESEEQSTQAPTHGEGHDQGKADSSVANLFSHYLLWQEHLAADRADTSLADLRASLMAASKEEGVAQSNRAALESMHGKLASLGDNADVEAQRSAFHQLSMLLIEVAESVPTAHGLRVMHCSMAFDDEGADWIQRGEVLANPYFGSAMLRCGSQLRFVGSK